MTVRVLSDAPGGAVTLDAQAIPYGEAPTHLTFELPPGPFTVGTDVSVKVTVGEDKGSSLGRFEVFQLGTTPVGGGATTYYYGIIGQP